MAVSLQEVPKNIKEHLGSDQTTDLITDISKKAGLQSISTIPRLLFLLETKAVPAHDFIELLIKELDVTPERGKAIAREIKERVLEPIRPFLFEWGIDLSFIDTIKAPLLKDLIDIEAEMAKQKIEIETTIAEKKEKLVEVTAVKEGTKTQKGQPLILYQKKLAQKIKRPLIKTFSLPFKLFSSKTKPELHQPAVKAKIESLETFLKTTIKKRPLVAKIETPLRRAVHYSELRTPISPFGEEEELIDLTTLQKIKPKKSKNQSQTTNAPESTKQSEITSPETQPKLEGNMVDLKTP